MAARKRPNSGQPATTSEQPPEGLDTQEVAPPPGMSAQTEEVPPQQVAEQPALPETDPIPERPPGWDRPVNVEELNIFPEAERIPAKIAVDAFPQQRVTVRWHNPQTNAVERETEVDLNTAPMSVDEYALLAISMLPEAMHREFYMTLIQQHGYSPSRVLLSSLVNQARMDGGGMNIAAVESHAQDLAMHSGANMPFQPSPYPSQQGGPSFYQQPVRGMSECQYCFEHFQPRKFGQETCDSTCGLLKQGRQPYPALAQPKIDLRNQRLMQMGKSPDAGQPPAAGYHQTAGPQQPMGYQDEVVQSQAGSFKNSSPVGQPQYHQDQARVVDPNRQFKADPRQNAAPSAGQPVIDGPGLPPAEMMTGHQVGH